MSCARRTNACLSAAILLGLSAVSACRVESQADRQLGDESAAASRAFEAGNVPQAKLRYEALLRHARDLRDSVWARSGSLGLARAYACLGQGDAAEKIYDELVAEELKAGGPGNLSLFWDSIEIGLVYDALGRRQKAEESFLLGRHALDSTPRREDWIEPAKLLPSWLLAHASASGGDPIPADVTSADLKDLSRYYGKYPTLVTHNLRWKMDDLIAWGWNRQVELIRAFVREVGADQDPIWSYKKRG